MEEGEEWTACMAGALDDYLPDGVELSHSHEEGTQATPVWESEPHFLRAYSPAGYMPTGKGITSSRGGWLMGRHEERTPQQMEELDRYLTTKRDRFAWSMNDLGEYKGPLGPFRIELEEDHKVNLYVKPYNKSPFEKKVEEEKVPVTSYSCLAVMSRVRLSADVYL